MKSDSHVPGSELDKKLRSLYAANNVVGSQRLLLFFLYASDEEMRLLRMHPEFCSCDTTFGTNNEKKELFTIAFLDGNNNSFNGGRAYIPSAQTWVFNTIFKHCLPLFWGPTISKRLSLMVTDGCIQEYSAFINNCGSSKAFPNAIHALCYFHLAVQGILKHVYPCIPSSGGKFCCKIVSQS